MSNSELESLRKEVRKRRSAVTAKENRIKRNTGVDIRGTKEDPRRPLDVVDKYNKTQLRNYLNKLNAFMNRSVGYVAGAGGVPIPKKDWLEYKKLEKQYNSVGAMHFEDVANIFIPNAGMTIKQRDATIRPDSITAQGDIVVRPYSEISRNSTNIATPESIKKLIADMKKKTSKGYLSGMIKAAREQLNQMLDNIGNSELKTEANSLSDNQFNILWNYTNFATNVSGIYNIFQMQTVDSKDKWWSTVVEDYSNDIRELFDWAKSLPANQNKAIGS